MTQLYVNLSALISSTGVTQLTDKRIGTRTDLVRAFSFPTLFVPVFFLYYYIEQLLQIFCYRVRIFFFF